MTYNVFSGTLNLLNLNPQLGVDVHQRENPLGFPEWACPFVTPVHRQHESTEKWQTDARLTASFPRQRG